MMQAQDDSNTLDDRLDRWIELGKSSSSVSREDALAMLTTSDAAPARGAVPLLPLVHAAGQVRRRWFGARVQVHVLNNVQNGACPEDCGYCGQAKGAKTPIQPYKLKSREQIIAEAEHAADSGAHRYCMVLSGRGPSDADIDHMVDCVRTIKDRFGLETCLSSGLLDEAKAQRLKEAGLDRLNHNLNTSPSRYASICSTHTYDDRLVTLRAARAAGLQLCSGVIVGMGETCEDLVDLAFELRQLKAESIPVNFLVPIPGASITAPVFNGEPLTPEICLRALCMMRLVNPASEVRIAAGRELHLRSFQPLALEPGNSLFVDGYLLTRGDGPVRTLRMILDAGFEIDLQGREWPDELRRLVEAHSPESTPQSDDFDEVNITARFKDDVVSPSKIAKFRVRGVDAGL